MSQEKTKYPELLNQVVRPKLKDDHGFEKPITWQHLKDFANTLDENQLKQAVEIWGDHKGGGAYCIAIANEDGINPSGEGVEPVSLFKDDPNMAEYLDHEEIVINKGQIIIEVDF